MLPCYRMLILGCCLSVLLVAVTSSAGAVEGTTCQNMVEGEILDLSFKGEVWALLLRPAGREQAKWYQLEEQAVIRRNGRRVSAAGLKPALPGKSGPWALLHLGASGGVRRANAQDCGEEIVIIRTSATSASPGTLTGYRLTDLHPRSFRLRSDVSWQLADGSVCSGGLVAHFCKNHSQWSAYVLYDREGLVRTVVILEPSPFERE